MFSNCFISIVRIQLLCGAVYESIWEMSMSSHTHRQTYLISPHQHHYRSSTIVSNRFVTHVVLCYRLKELQAFHKSLPPSKHEILTFDAQPIMVADSKTSAASASSSSSSSAASAASGGLTGGN